MHFLVEQIFQLFSYRLSEMHWNTIIQCFTQSSQSVTVNYGYIGVVRWAELMRPQRWAGVITCPPRR